MHRGLVLWPVAACRPPSLSSHFLSSLQTVPWIKPWKAPKKKYFERTNRNIEAWQCICSRLHAVIQTCHSGSKNQDDDGRYTKSEDSSVSPQTSRQRQSRFTLKSNHWFLFIYFFFFALCVLGWHHRIILCFPSPFSQRPGLLNHI